MRDSLGRQSLLIGSDLGDIVLTSVAAKSLGTFIELPPLGIYKLEHLADRTLVSLYPWQEIDAHEVYSNQLSELQELFSNIIDVYEPLQPAWLQNMPENTSVSIYFLFLSVTKTKHSISGALQNYPITMSC